MNVKRIKKITKTRKSIRASISFAPSRGDHIRTNPKIKPQTELIQTENRKTRIWFGCIWMAFLLNREPQNRKSQKPRLTAKTALSFYYIHETKIQKYYRLEI
jgi:hypothetical protein